MTAVKWPNDQKITFKIAEISKKRCGLYSLAYSDVHVAVTDLLHVVTEGVRWLFSRIMKRLYLLSMLNAL